MGRNASLIGPAALVPLMAGQPHIQGHSDTNVAELGCYNMPVTFLSRGDMQVVVLASVVEITQLQRTPVPHCGSTTLTHLATAVQELQLQTVYTEYTNIYLLRASCYAPSNCQRFAFGVNPEKRLLGMRTVQVSS